MKVAKQKWSVEKIDRWKKCIVYLRPWEEKRVRGRIQIRLSDKFVKPHAGSRRTKGIEGTMVGLYPTMGESLVRNIHTVKVGRNVKTCDRN